MEAQAKMCNCYCHRNNNHPQVGRRFKLIRGENGKTFIIFKNAIQNPTCYEQDNQPDVSLCNRSHFIDQRINHDPQLQNMLQINNLVLSRQLIKRVGIKTGCDVPICTCQEELPESPPVPLTHYSSAQSFLGQEQYRSHVLPFNTETPEPLKIDTSLADNRQPKHRQDNAFERRPRNEVQGHSFESPLPSKLSRVSTTNFSSTNIQAWNANGHSLQRSAPSRIQGVNTSSAAPWRKMGRDKNYDGCANDVTNGQCGGLRTQAGDSSLMKPCLPPRTVRFEKYLYDDQYACGLTLAASGTCNVDADDGYEYCPQSSDDINEGFHIDSYHENIGRYHCGYCGCRLGGGSYEYQARGSHGDNGMSENGGTFENNVVCKQEGAIKKCNICKCEHGSVRDDGLCTENDTTNECKTGSLYGAFREFVRVLCEYKSRFVSKVFYEFFPMLRDSEVEGDDFPQEDSICECKAECEYDALHEDDYILCELIARYQPNEFHQEDKILFLVCDYKAVSLGEDDGSFDLLQDCDNIDTSYCKIIMCDQEHECDDIKDVNEGDDINDVNKGDNVNDVDESDDINDIDESDDINDIDESDDVNDVDESHDINDVDESDDVNDVDESHDINDIDESDDVNDVDESDDIKDVDESHDINDVDESDDTDVDDMNYDVESDDINFNDVDDMNYECEDINDVDGNDDMLAAIEGYDMQDVDENDYIYDLPERGHSHDLSDYGDTHDLHESHDMHGSDKSDVHATVDNLNDFSDFERSQQNVHVSYYPSIQEYDNLLGLQRMLGLAVYSQVTWANGVNMRPTLGRSFMSDGMYRDGMMSARRRRGDEKQRDSSKDSEVREGEKRKTSKRISESTNGSHRTSECTGGSDSSRSKKKSADGKKESSDGKKKSTDRTHKYVEGKRVGSDGKRKRDDGKSKDFGGKSKRDDEKRRREDEKRKRDDGKRKSDNENREDIDGDRKSQSSVDKDTDPLQDKVSGHPHDSSATITESLEAEMPQTSPESETSEKPHGLRHITSWDRIKEEIAKEKRLHVLNTVHQLEDQDDIRRSSIAHKTIKYHADHEYIEHPLVARMLNKKFKRN